ncbi:MAG: hypothetical protein EOO43_00640 [Flavobacterium sp.]|nr:MAG: hypothetical protein EOO43_00640 [Flavobacterium sp.]
MIKKHFFMFCFAGIISTVAAQQDSDPNIGLIKAVPASPIATSLGKYGEIPIGMSTGLPEISIPLFSYGSGTMTGSVSLSYNASGLKVSEIAPWVGAGWSLNAGGTITRTVRGIPDELQFFKTGYFMTVNQLKAGLSSYPYTTPIRDKLVSAGRGEADTEADIFYFNFAGQSGKFYYNQQTGKFHTLVKSNLKISYEDETGFVIVTENGDRYYFTEKEYTTTRTICNPSIADSDKMNLSSWYLKKITNDLGSDQIDFEYDGSTHSTFKTVANATKYVWQSSSGTSASLFPDPVDQSCYSIIGITSKKVSRISWRGGFLTFTANANRCDYLGEKSLDKIELFTANNISLQSYVFNYGYFGGSDSPINCGIEEASELLRLKLKSVVQQAPSQNLILTNMIHSFDYYNEFDSFPSRLSFAQDYWGFYNGATYNSSLIPGYIKGGLSTSSGNNRFPEPSYAKYGLLKKITYPTKGNTEFEYEGNVANGSVSLIPAQTEALAGGLRIRKVTNHDGLDHNKDTHKRYSYLMDDNTTSGQLVGPWSNSFGDIFEVEFFSHNSIWLHQERRFYSKVTSNTNYPLLSSGGGYVSYKRVGVEADTTGANGSMIYEYSAQPDFINTTFPYPVTHMDWTRGQLEKEIYLQNSIDEPISREITYVHPYPYGNGALTDTAANKEQLGFKIGFLKSVNYMPGYDWNNYFGPDSIANTLIPKFAEYQTISGWNGPITTKTTEYSYGDWRDSYSRTGYNMNNHKVNYIVNHVNGSDSIIVKTMFISDYIGTLPTWMQNIKNKNYVTLPIERLRIIKGVDGDFKVVGGYIYKYKDDQVLTSEIFSLNISAPIPLNSFTQSHLIGGQLQMDARYVSHIKYNSYDTYGNVLEQQLSDGPRTSYVWGYGNSYPTLEARNAGLGDIAYTSFEEENSGGWVIGSPNRSNDYYTGKNSYDLANGSVYRMGLDPNKRFSVSYWSKNGPAGISGTFATMRTTNSGWTSYIHVLPLGTTSISLTGNVTVDDLLLSPSNSQSTLYNYDPLVGIISRISPNGQTEFYEYDAFGRLKLTKDRNGNIRKAIDYHYKP